MTSSDLAKYSVTWSTRGLSATAEFVKLSTAREITTRSKISSSRCLLATLVHMHRALVTALPCYGALEIVVFDWLIDTPRAALTFDLSVVQVFDTS